MMLAGLVLGEGLIPGLRLLVAFWLAEGVGEGEGGRSQSFQG